MKTPIPVSAASVRQALCCLFLVVVLLLWNAIAQCAPPPAGVAPVQYPGGGFAIDGNLVAGDGPGDWLPGTGSGGAVLDSAGKPLSPNMTFHFTDPYGGNDSIFSGGLKWYSDPNGWTYTSGKPQSKCEINNVLVHITTDAAGHLWAIISADRLSNSGDSYIDFEFLQNPLVRTNNSQFKSDGPNGGRTTNDMLLSLVFTSGGSVADLIVWRWLPDGTGGFAYKDATAALPVGRVFAALNTAAIPVPYGAFGQSIYGANAFAEAAVDLTALLNNFDPCMSIGIKTMMVKTKASQSSSASIEDFIDPIQCSMRIGPSADAGPGQSRCSEGEATAFSLQGTVSAGLYPVATQYWSVISGNAALDSINSLATTAHVSSPSATLRLTAIEENGCVVSSDVMLTVRALPVAFIAGPETVCPRSSAQFQAPAGAQSYAWSITGNGAISGPANAQTVTVIAGPICGENFSLSLSISSNSCPVSVSTNVLVFGIAQPILTLPPDQVLECPADTRTNATGVAQVQGGCGLVTISYEDATSMVGARVVIARTWTAKDDCNNTSSGVQSITVQDTTKPLLNAPADVVLECPADIDPTQTGLATAQDACGSVNVTFVDAVTPGCGNTKVIARTWTATDQAGNSSSAVQTITVHDTTRPTLKQPADLTLDCPADTGTSNTGMATAEDSCGQVTITFSDVVQTNCGQTKVIARTWTATDECGNASSAVQTITVGDNLKPTITCPGDVTLECPADTGTANTGIATAEDTCGKVTISFNDSVRDNCGQTKVITRTWTATDECGNSAACNQIITVQDTTPPTVTSCPADATIECPARPVFGAPVFADGCDQSLTVTFADVTTPGNCVDRIKEKVTRTWTATDDCGLSVACSQTITIVDTTPPVLSDCPTVNPTIQCYAAVPAVVNVTASDGCQGILPVIFSQTETKPGSSCNNAITRTWTVTDDCGNSSTCSQTITVQDTTAPTVTSCPTDATIECPARPVFGTPVFADNCDQDLAVTYADVTMPGNCLNGVKEKVTRTWTATDDCGWSVSCSQTITVVDTTPPVLSGCPAVNPTVQCYASVPAAPSVTASDACEGAMAVVFNETESKPGSSCGNIITRTWTATDACGNMSTCTQTITVQDTTPPTVTSCPADATIECPAQPVFGTPVFADNCDSTLGVTFADATTPGNCVNRIKQKVTRTWTATDDCGLSVSCSQTITVVDTTPPVLSGCPSANPTVQCYTAVPAVANVSANDACQGSIAVVFSQNESLPGTSCNNIITRTWTATDECGNQSSCSQTITVRDTTAPVITSPAAIRVQCVGDVPPPYASLAAFLAAGGRASDNCDSTLEFTLLSNTSDNRSCPLTITRIYQVIDDCGNSAKCTQTVTVDDTIAPAITCPTNRILECTAPFDPANTGTAKATDNCDPNVTVTYTDTPVQSEYNIRWYAADPGANSAPYLPTYVKLAPRDLPVPEEAIRTGRAADPLRNAVAYGPSSSVLDALTSLSGESLHFGQVQPFEAVIEVGPVPGPERGTIEFTADFSTHTTSNDRFGYDPNYMIYAAFVDYADLGTRDPHQNARVVSFTSKLINAGTIAEKIQGTFRVSGLDSDDRVVVEVWVVLVGSSSGNGGGTIAADLVGAQKVTTPPVPIAIGNQTVSINANKITPLPAPQAQPPLPPLPPQPPIPVGMTVSAVDRTWTAIDACGNRSACVQRLTFRDTTAPVLIAPEDRVLECPAEITTNQTGVATAQDACGLPVVITYNDSVSNICGGSQVITRTWLATDEGGLSSTAVQTITILDTTKPALSIPADLSLECGTDTSTARTGMASAQDFGGLVTVSYSDVTSTDCGATRVIHRTWTATDECGNSRSAVQTITIGDTTKPVILVPADVVLQCPADTSVKSTGMATAYDSCGKVSIQYTDANRLTCGSMRIITRNWTATDQCGNTASAVQTITLQDTTPPLLTCMPDFTVEANETWAFDEPVAMDACSAVTLQIAGTVTNTLATNLWVATRTWIAADACGNQATCQQNVTVVKTAPPRLEIYRLAGESVRLQWLAPATGFQLESSDDLANWSVVPATPVLLNGYKVVELRKVSPQTLFRLSKPATYFRP